MLFMSYDTESKSRNVLASPLGEEGHEVAKGCTRVRMIMRYSYSMSYRPLRGKRLTTFCASLALLHPLLSLTHWIFRSLTLPYKSSSLVQNVFSVHRFAQGAADWRSGPRWTILSLLCPVHPFPLRGTSPRWEACHWIFRSLRSLTNPVPLPPQGETRK